MKVVTDYDAILNDDSINCVVELMGGVTDAKEVSVMSVTSHPRTRARDVVSHKQKRAEIATCTHTHQR